MTNPAAERRDPKAHHLPADDWEPAPNTTPPNPHRQVADTDADAALHAALAKLVAGDDVRRTAEWEDVGLHLIVLARREARRWPQHSTEYSGEFIAAGIDLLRKRPAAVIGARSPWGVIIAAGRHAGQRAVGAETVCGLTARDPVTHRVRFAHAPRVVSLDRLIETANAPSNN